MNYWQRRQQQLNQQLEKDEARLKKRLSSFYDTEFRKLDRQIAAYYKQYGTDHVIEYRQLLESLPPEDQRLLIEQMDVFAEKYPQYAHLMPVRESVYKLDRLEGLQYSVRMQQLGIGAVTQKEIREHLERQALRGGNTAAQAMGFGENFYSMNPDIVKQFVGAAWSNGENFSQKIWKNTEKLAGYLNTDIAQGFARGDSYEKLIRNLRQRFGKVSRKDAYRLIYTEGTYVMAEATMQPFTEDFEEYRLSTAADGKVCDICRELAKKKFRIQDRQPGVNFPPLHPWCRCTFTIEVEDWDKWMEDYERKNRNVQAEIVAERFNSAIIELSDSEKYALNQYISFESYRVNEKLRKGLELTEKESKMVENLDSALQKMPYYAGTLLRSLYFGDPERAKSYISEMQVDDDVSFTQFISTTNLSEPYNPEGEIQIFIPNSKKGRDITAFNSSESEVLYERNSEFKVKKIIDNDGVYYIILEEL